VQKPTSSGIFYDAWRFISRSYTVIQHSPLHTYYSALAFAPSKSLLYNKYHKDRIHNLCDLDCVPEQWNATISDLPVHVYQVAFSADSSQLAFWTDDELNLLDARSGTPLKTFKGDRFALSEDFSVVAISEDRTVALRCVATDVPIRTLTHTTKVKWLNLSLDGTRIAATLSDDTVCLWDRSRGETMGNPAGHDRGQLEFLPSDKMAYVSTEGDIKLWDEAAGGIFAELDCRSSFFTISHDASRLASLDGANLGLWNTENGELIGVAEDDGNKITISDDGSFIATWIYMGREVRLWSGNSLSLIATLRVDEPGDWISSLALSSDLLAIGC
jgi:WD40 repeat protein